MGDSKIHALAAIALWATLATLELALLNIAGAAITVLGTSSGAVS